MITIDELKSKLGGYKVAVDDLKDALAIEASQKRVMELEHKMTLPGFYDDAEASQKVFAEMSDLKGKLERFEKLRQAYEDAETLLQMLEEENDPELLGEGEEAVTQVEKLVEELQLITMLSGEYDHNNAILTFHAGTGGTEAQDWAQMLFRMYTRWGEAPRLQGVHPGLSGRGRGRPEERLHHGGGPQRLRLCSRARTGCTGWCASAPLTPTAAGRPALPAWK